MPLIKNIKISGIQCYIGETQCNIFGYADDIVILASTVYSLKRLVLLCKQYSKTFNVQFNTNKSMLMSFTRKTT